MCCPGNTTCPSSSVVQATGCGEKLVDCQAPLSAESTCAIGGYVFCPASTAADVSAVETAGDSEKDVSLSSAQAKQCSAHPKCVAAGLQGNCCPATEGGTPLDCCEGTFTN